MKTTRDLHNEIINKINPVVRFSVTRYVLAIGLFLAIFAFGLIGSVGWGRGGAMEWWSAGALGC